MILTPLQLLAIVTLILTVSSLITWAMFMRLEDKLSKRIDNLYDHFGASTQSDGLLDPWEQLMVFDRLQEQRDGWGGGTETR